MNYEIAEIVDELGVARAAMAAARDEVKRLEDKLKGFGEGRHEGMLYSANVFVSQRKTFDWRAIAEKLNPSRQLKAAHQKTTWICNVRVTAKLKEVA